MAFFSLDSIRIKGIAAAVPKGEISNWDYTYITEQERNLLIKTIGIEKRKATGDSGITTSDLCFSSAEKLIVETNTPKEDINILIFVSQTPDYLIPASSIVLQNKLGLPKTCMAFDINLGCSGYIYGLSTISSIMKVGKLKKGILLTGDVSTLITPWEDKSIYPLFGDAGTATLLEYDEDADKITFDLNSDGSGYEAIIYRDGMARSLAAKESSSSLGKGKMELNGTDIFNFSVTVVPKSIEDFFQKTGTSLESYDYFVMHQANLLMNEAIRKKLNFPREKTPYSLSKYGNTSSASIPLTIVSELRNKVERDVSWLLSGFGVGLSWATMSLNTKKLICPEIIEL